MARMHEYLISSMREVLENSECSKARALKEIGVNCVYSTHKQCHQKKTGWRKKRRNYERRAGRREGEEEGEGGSVGRKRNRYKGI